MYRCTKNKFLRNGPRAISADRHAEMLVFLFRTVSAGTFLTGILFAHLSVVKEDTATGHVQCTAVL